MNTTDIANSLVRSFITVIFILFLGNFTATGISLFGNQLTVFEEGVFSEILQQMMAVGPSPIGYVAINQSMMCTSL